jgi:hypothetical protein
MFMSLYKRKRRFGIGGSFEYLESLTLNTQAESLAKYIKILQNAFSIFFHRRVSRDGEILSILRLAASS